MENQFEPLDRGEVLSVNESVQILIGHQTFRVDELAQALKAQLLEHQIGGLTEQKTGWFNAEGAECQVLRYGAGNWQKGKVRISFEFCPEDANGFATAKTAVVSPPETTVATAPMGLRKETKPAESATVADESADFLEPADLLPEETFTVESETTEAGEDFLESVDLSSAEESDFTEEVEAIEESEDILASAEEPIMEELAGVEEELAPETEDIWAEKEELSELEGSSLVEAETEKLWLDEDNEGEEIAAEDDEIDMGGGLVEDIFDDAPDSSLLEEEDDEIDMGGELVEDIFDDAPDSSPLEEEDDEIDMGGELVEDIFDDAPDGAEEEEEDIDVDGGLVEDIFDDAPDGAEEEDLNIFAEASATTPTTDEVEAELEFGDEDIFAESLDDGEIEEASDSIFDTNAFEEEESSLEEDVFADVSDDELDLGDAFGSSDNINIPETENAEKTDDDINFEAEDEDELFSNIDDDLDWGASGDDELALDDSSESGAENEEEEAVLADIWQDIDEFS
ncbi:MAG: KGK domain-containing protein [Cyanobacteria bacterium P01_E01_bin.42]